MKLLSMILPAIMLMACSSGAADKSAEAAAQAETAETPKWPAFNADSAFAFTARQVDFGPRVPGTPAHRQCRDYLTEKLAGYGADTVMVQEATVTAFDGTRLPMANIMARFNA
ncbi:MAG: glutamine cyclotransferase, partial [Paramuribaculum sp.]